MLTLWRLSVGAGVVSSHRHAGGKYDVGAGEEAHPATQRNHHVITLNAE